MLNSKKFKLLGISLSQIGLVLLGDAIRRPDDVYTYNAHAASHRVTHETARNDLHQLYERGLLRRRKSGRRHVFSPAPDLQASLRRR